MEVCSNSDIAHRDNLLPVYQLSPYKPWEESGGDKVISYSSKVYIYIYRNKERERGLKGMTGYIKREIADQYRKSVGLKRLDWICRFLMGITRINGQ